MRLILIGFVAVWVASLSGIACVFLSIWFFEWRGSRSARESRIVRDEPMDRMLAGDRRLLVPWSAVRASKLRLGVDESLFRASDEEQAADAPKAPPPSSDSQAA
jgi:hypothetical protein